MDTLEDAMNLNAPTWFFVLVAIVLIVVLIKLVGGDVHVSL